MTEQKRGRGRPPKDESLQRRAMFLPASVWAKIDEYGLQWAREVLSEAKPPKRKD